MQKSSYLCLLAILGLAGSAYAVQYNTIAAQPSELLTPRQLSDMMELVRVRNESPDAAYHEDYTQDPDYIRAREIASGQAYYSTNGKSPELLSYFASGQTKYPVVTTPATTPTSTAAEEAAIAAQVPGQAAQYNANAKVAANDNLSEANAQINKQTVSDTGAGLDASMVEDTKVYDATSDTINKKYSKILNAKDTIAEAKEGSSDDEAVDSVDSKLKEASDLSPTLKSLAGGRGGYNEAKIAQLKQTQTLMSSRGKDQEAASIQKQIDTLKGISATEASATSVGGLSEEERINAKIAREKAAVGYESPTP